MTKMSSSASPPPTFVYGRDLADPDDNRWGPFWTDPAATPAEAKDAR